MRRTKTMLMGDLLEEFFKRPYIAAKVAEGKLPDTWREIVGDRAADVTTELRLEKHILYVRIQSSVLRSELFYQREALKEEINRRSGVRLVNAVIIRVSPGSAKSIPYIIYMKKDASFSRSIFFSMAGRFHSPSPIRPGLI